MAEETRPSVEILEGLRKRSKICDASFKYAILTLKSLIKAEEVGDPKEDCQLLAVFLNFTYFYLKQKLAPALVQDIEFIEARLNKDYGEFFQKIDL
jgi:hypothetical protein